MDHLRHGLLAIILVLVNTACAPNKTVAETASQFYLPDDAENSILISGFLDNAAKAYLGGVAKIHPLVIKFGDQLVASGNLNSHYEGMLSGNYEDKPVSVSCAYQKVTSEWRKVTCRITHEGKPAVTLTF